MLRLHETEVFALRDAERLSILEEPPASGRFIAVRAVSVDMPDGPRRENRTSDGADVKMAAIIASVRSSEDGTWLWCHLSCPTKERIGDLLFEHCKVNRWYYITIEDMEAEQDLDRWRRYATYCNACAKSGEPPMDFDAFLARSVIESPAAGQ